MATDNTTLVKAYAWIQAMERIKRCDDVIRQYAEAGISGTLHDIEHRNMRGEAVAAEAILWRAMT